MTRKRKPREPRGECKGDHLRHAEAPSLRHAQVQVMDLQRFLLGRVVDPKGPDPLQPLRGTRLSFPRGPN